MLCYNRIDICEGIDVAEFVAIGFLIIGLNFKILYVMNVMIKSVDCNCIIHGIRKFESISLLENSVHEDCGYIQKTCEGKQLFASEYGLAK